LPVWACVITGAIRNNAIVNDNNCNNLDTFLFIFFIIYVLKWSTLLAISKITNSWELKS
jgi:hypothetical protein